MLRKNKKLCDLMEVAERHGIVELSVMPDVIVSIPPTMTVLKFNLLLPSKLFRQQPKFRLRYQRAISGVLGSSTGAWEMPIYQQ
jgi:hypothetical protein